MPPPTPQVRQRLCIAGPIQGQTSCWLRPSRRAGQALLQAKATLRGSIIRLRPPEALFSFSCLDKWEADRATRYWRLMPQELLYSTRKLDCTYGELTTS